MKWLVFSDSHGLVEDMLQAIEREKPDRVLHLGDVVRDGQQLLSHLGPAVPLEQVRGNCDLEGCGMPLEKELFFGSKRIWLLHGHTYRVKLGVGLLAAEARIRGVDAVLFGHTHVPVCYQDGGLWVMNPGTISGRPRSTYGVIEERDGTLYCRTAVLKETE